MSWIMEKWNLTSKKDAHHIVTKKKYSSQSLSTEKSETDVFLILTYCKIKRGHKHVLKYKERREPGEPVFILGLQTM